MTSTEQDAEPAGNKYKIVIQTSDIRNAGTDANVFIRMYGENGESPDLQLDNTDDNFERNKADEFFLEIPSVGHVKRLQVWHDNTGMGPGWHLDRVTIFDEDAGFVYEFPCQRWLAKNEDDGKIMRDLVVNLGVVETEKPDATDGKKEEEEPKEAEKEPEIKQEPEEPEKPEEPPIDPEVLAFMNFQGLHTAIMQDDLGMLEKYSQSGINLDQKFDDRIDQQHAGITPLALSCALNKVKSTEILLNNGANVNVPFAALNTTALMTSSFHGHEDVVKLLLSRGADVRAADMQESTALGYAFGGTRNMNVVNALLEANIDVNRKNMLGMNALLLVAGYGSPQLVSMILRANADPTTVNDFGHTALHLAVVGKQDMLRKLRLHGNKDAAMADRSLNRRNLDVAVTEWARLHGGSTGEQEALAQAGTIMMSIGQQLEDTPHDDAQGEDLERRVQAVWKYRELKLAQAREKKKSGIWNLLSCGGGRSKQTGNIKAGSKPLSAPPQQGQTPQEGNEEARHISEAFAQILHMLIEAGCEKDRPDRTFGMTALDLAILNGDVESSAVLAGAGADPNHFLRMIALRDFYRLMVNNQRKEAKELLEIDEDLDINTPFSRFNMENDADEGLTPLTLAARMDDIEIAKMMLKKGALVNECGPAGKYPLTEAAAIGSRRMADLLMTNGGYLEVPSPAFQNATPVAVAAMMKRLELVEYFIKRGAKVDRLLADGRCLVLKMYEANDTTMVDRILMANLDQNFIDADGLTAQLAAAYQKRDGDHNVVIQDLAKAVEDFDIQEEAEMRNHARNAQNEVMQPMYDQQPQQQIVYQQQQQQHQSPPRPQTLAPAHQQQRQPSPQQQHPSPPHHPQVMENHDASPVIEQQIQQTETSVSHAAPPHRLSSPHSQPPPPHPTSSPPHSPQHHQPPLPHHPPPSSPTRPTQAPPPIPYRSPPSDDPNSQVFVKTHSVTFADSQEPVQQVEQRTVTRVITTTVTDEGVGNKVVTTRVVSGDGAPIANMDDESGEEESGSETESETGSEEESGSESESGDEDEGEDQQQNQQVVTREVTKTVRQIVTVNEHTNGGINGQAATEHQKPGETCV